MLLLRGNDHAHKTICIRLAESLGLKDVGVFFPPPVCEGLLIAAAAEADIGVIPYKPTIINFRYCCPNKLSEYMQAGLPLMAGNTELRQPDRGRIRGRGVLRSGRSRNRSSARSAAWCKTSRCGDDGGRMPSATCARTFTGRPAASRFTRPIGGWRAR